MSHREHSEHSPFRRGRNAEGNEANGVRGGERRRQARTGADTTKKVERASSRAWSGADGVAVDAATCALPYWPCSTSGRCTATR